MFQDRFKNIDDRLLQLTKENKVGAPPVFL